MFKKRFIKQLTMVAVNAAMVTVAVLFSSSALFTQRKPESILA